MNGVYKGLFLTIVKTVKIVTPSEKKVSYVKGDTFLYLLFTVSGFVNKQLRKNKITPLPLDNSHLSTLTSFLCP